MAANGDVDTSRVAVKTYVPAYQKDEWKSHADRLGMSQSEFVRSMVQAGRRGFLAESDSKEETSETNHESSQGANQGEELKDRVIESLATDEHLEWEQLLEALTDDIESRLEDTLAELQEENVVRYSGRHGGYTLTDQ